MFLVWITGGFGTWISTIFAENTCTLTSVLALVAYVIGEILYAVLPDRDWASNIRIAGLGLAVGVPLATGLFSMFSPALYLPFWAIGSVHISAYFTPYINILASIFVVLGPPAIRKFLHSKTPQLNRTVSRTWLSIPAILLAIGIFFLARIGMPMLGESLRTMAEIQKAEDCEKYVKENPERFTYLLQPKRK